jgi:agmatine/peptidylarginine deiminase
MTYRLPPEWHPQDAIMLTWPHADTDWAPYLNEVEPVYIEISRQVLKRQSLVVICHDELVQTHVQVLLMGEDHLIKGRLYRSWVTWCHLARTKRLQDQMIKQVHHYQHTV